MKSFVTTPEEFISGESFWKARDLVRQGRPKVKPRLRKPGKPHGPSQERQIGTVSAEEFEVGWPAWGHRAHGHRTGPVPKLKPLPEDIVNDLLESDDADDPEAWE
jgi:hypothetical protein